MDGGSLCTGNTYCRSNQSVEMKIEKSVAVTNEKVSNYIPDDLAFSILSKLPPKSLKRFGCVSKSWALLFENPFFMSRYRINFLSNHRCYLDDASLFMVLPNPFPHEATFKVFGSGSINGILCLRETRYERVVLWNTATEEFKVIPPSHVELSLLNFENYWVRAYYDLHGFGYDSIRDDYKVICHVRVNPIWNFDRNYEPSDRNLSQRGKISLDPLWEIYSLRSNSWRKLDVDIPSHKIPASYGSVEVYMDGMCHWLCLHHENNYTEACLVSFDLSNEVFFNTPIPSYDRVKWANLMVLNGSIALISYDEQTTFHISILGELGVKESWIILFIIGPLPCVELPIRMGKKGEIFFRKKDNKLARIYLNTKKTEEVDLKGKTKGV